VAASLTLLIAAEVLALSVWFSASAVLAGLAAQAGLPQAALAPLATATQLGFVAGALTLAVSGLPDRADPRRVFAASAWLAAGANAALLLVPPDSAAALVSRALVGAALAGVYPVGMKIAVGWSLARRGLIVGALVGALTLGSASPHAIALWGGAEPRGVLLATSAAAVLAGLLVLGVRLGPHHARAPAFAPAAIRLAWSEPRIRSAFLGYFGHMWELYAFWAWVAVIAAAAGAAPSLTAFVAIAAGGLACVPAGWLADRYGRARVARGSMLASAAAGLATAASFGGPPALVALLLVLWGLTIVPDSAQFSALVADAAPPALAGSLLAAQTALGFALSALTVQALPAAAAAWGWPVALALLAIGPLLGAAALRGR
jgi:MFS family permease